MKHTLTLFHGSSQIIEAPSLPKAIRTTITAEAFTAPKASHLPGSGLVVPKLTALPTNMILIKAVCRF